MTTFDASAESEDSLSPALVVEVFRVVLILDEGLAVVLGVELLVVVFVVLFVVLGVVDLVVLGVVLFNVLGAVDLVVLIFGVVLGAAGVVLTGTAAVVVTLIPRFLRGGNFLSQKLFASGICASGASAPYRALEHTGSLAKTPAARQNDSQVHVFILECAV